MFVEPPKMNCPTPYVWTLAPIATELSKVAEAPLPMAMALVPDAGVKPVGLKPRAIEPLPLAAAPLPMAIALFPEAVVPDGPEPKATEPLPLAWAPWPTAVAKVIEEEAPARAACPTAVSDAPNAKDPCPKALEKDPNACAPWPNADALVAVANAELPTAVDPPVEEALELNPQANCARVKSSKQGEAEGVVTICAIAGGLSARTAETPRANTPADKNLDFGQRPHATCAKARRHKWQHI
ncbi:MAG: hypothetical protein ABSD08_03380 [Xanthobacteraceae bacterium]